MSIIQDFYNERSHDYSNSKMLPFRSVETYNFMQLVKQITSKEVKIILDVACGTGFYTRKLKELVHKVIGVDISENMIHIARRITDANLDIDYIHYDASMLSDLRESLPQVDAVSGAFFLNYAQNQTILIKYLKSVASVLKPGGVFFGINDNPRDDGSWHNQNIFKKIGFDKCSNQTRVEGQPLIYKAYNEDGSVLEIVNYWISPDKFKEAFVISGFEDFEWIDMQHIPKDVRMNDAYLNDLYSKYYNLFDLMINAAPVIFFKATRV